MSIDLHSSNSKVAQQEISTAVGTLSQQIGSHLNLLTKHVKDATRQAKSLLKLYFTNRQDSFHNQITQLRLNSLAYREIVHQRFHGLSPQKHTLLGKLQRAQWGANFMLSNNPTLFFTPKAPNQQLQTNVLSQKIGSNLDQLSEEVAKICELARIIYHLYREGLKNRENDKEAPQIFCSERGAVLESTTRSENTKFVGKPTSSGPDSSVASGIHQHDRTHFFPNFSKSVEKIRGEILVMIDVVQEKIPQASVIQQTVRSNLLSQLQNAQNLLSKM